MRLSLLFLCVLMGCGLNQKQHNSQFNSEEYFIKQAEQLTANGFKLEQVLYYANKTDTVVKDSVNWQKILAAFIELNPSKPQFTGRFNEVKSTGSTTYIAKENNLRVKKYQIEYSDKQEVDRIQIWVQEKNNLYGIEQYYYFKPDSGFVISGNQQVRVLPDAAYKVEARFIK